MPSIRLLCPLILGLLAACSTTFRPAVVVRGSAPFPGIADIVAEAGRRPVDVLLVHGMCTHDRAWAEDRIARIAGAVARELPPAPDARSAAGGRIEVVERRRELGGGTVRFHALLWSPLTREPKRQLEFDRSGDPTDCARDAECRPARASLNGAVKDRLLDDCLADALIYEGDSQGPMRDAMVETVARIVEGRPDEGEAGALVVVAESLGSKMLFDALGAMLESPLPRLRELGLQAARRLGLLFMAGNQLPLFSLARQSPAARAAPPPDALQRFLDLRRRRLERRAGSLDRLAVVAFTDPNDLLSYRLLPARYAAPDVLVADVLVSNAPAWLGLVENPLAAHLDYLANPEVGALIACGFPRERRCR